MRRTVHFEIGTAVRADGRRAYWTQQRWSDGEVRPLGIPHDTEMELLAYIEDILGDTYGMEHAIVEMGRIPQSGVAFVN